MSLSAKTMIISTSTSFDEDDETRDMDSSFIDTSESQGKMQSRDQSSGSVVEDELFQTDTLNKVNTYFDIKHDIDENKDDDEEDNDNEEEEEDDDDEDESSYGDYPPNGNHNKHFDFSKQIREELKSKEVNELHVSSAATATTTAVAAEGHSSDILKRQFDDVIENFIPPPGLSPSHNDSTDKYQEIKNNENNNDNKMLECSLPEIDVKIVHTPRPQTVINHEHYTRLFFDASLEVLEERENTKSSIYDFWRQRCPDLPAYNETIIFGFLHKQSRATTFGHVWKSKFVIICPGRMFVFDDNSSSSYFSSFHQTTPTHSAQLNQATSAVTAAPTLSASGTNSFSNSNSYVNGYSRERYKTIIFRPGECKCRKVDKKGSSENGKYLFEVITLSSDIVVNNESLNEAMNAINEDQEFHGNGRGGYRSSSKSLHESSDYHQDITDGPSDFDTKKAFKRIYYAMSEKERDKWVCALNLAMSPELSPTIVFSSNHCSALRSKVMKAKTVFEYVQVLKNAISRHIGSAGFVVPVDYINEIQGRGIREIPSSMEQVFKDFERDTCEINGKIIVSNTCATFYAFMEEMLQKGKEAQISDITTSSALSTARKVFLACCRTESGGVTFAVIREICENINFSRIVSNSSSASPFRILIQPCTFDSYKGAKLDNGSSSPIGKAPEPDASSKSIQRLPSKESDFALRKQAAEKAARDAVKQEISPSKSIGLDDESDSPVRRSKHRKTASDPFSYRFLQGIMKFGQGSSASSSAGSSLNPNYSVSTSSVDMSPPFEGINISSGSSKDLNKSLSPGRAGSPSLLMLTRQQSSDETMQQEKYIKVTVELNQTYDLVDCESPDIKYGEIHGMFTRSFAYSNGSIVAIGQGWVSLGFESKYKFEGHEGTQIDEETASNLLRQSKERSAKRRSSLTTLLGTKYG